MRPIKTTDSDTPRQVCSTTMAEALLTLEKRRIFPLALNLGLVFCLIATYRFIRSSAAPSRDFWVHALTAVSLLFIATVEKKTQAPRLSRILGFLIFVLAAGNCLLFLVLKKDIEQTLFIILSILGAAFLNLDFLFFGIELGLTWLAWFLACVPWLGETEWDHYFVSLFFGSVLAVGVNIAQHRMLSTMETMRCSSKRQADEIRDALERSLRSEEFSKTLSAASFEGIIIHDGQVILDTNEQADALFGFSPGGLKGGLLSSRIAASDWSVVQNHVVHDSESAYEVRGCRRDGNPIPLEIRGRTILREGRRVRVVVFRDLSARKLMEASLRKNEENYRLLTDNSTDLIVRLSLEGRCLFASSASAQLLGFSSGELIGRKVFEFVHPLDKRAIANLAGSGQLFSSKQRITCRLKRRDGSFRWFESTCQSFTDFGTKEMEIVVIARDIGERIKTEQNNAVRHAIAAIKSAKTNSDKDMPRFLKAICEIMHWELGEIWLVDEEKMVLRLTNSWSAPSSRLVEFSVVSRSIAFAFGLGLPGIVWSKRQAHIIPDLSSESLFVRRAEAKRAGFNSAIGVALVDEPRVYGVMTFLSRRKIEADRDIAGLMDESGREIADYISKSQAFTRALAESAKLGELVEERTTRIRALQAEIARQQRLEQDVRLAAEVQQSLMPREQPILPGFELASLAIPARLISGDFYDFLISPENICEIVIADVSGKGIPAAMMTSAARAVFRHEGFDRIGPGHKLATLGASLFNDLERTEMFITAQLLQIDLDRGSINYASAGHTEALRFKPWTRSCDRLPSTALPLGILKEYPIGEIDFTLRPGEILVLYSDGVTEASDAEGALFGMERLETILAQSAHLSAPDIAHAIIEEVRVFSRGMPSSDDLSLIVLKATPRIIRLHDLAPMEKLEGFVAFVRNAAEVYSENDASVMELVASELITNIITHSFGSHKYRDRPGAIDLYIRLESDRMVIDLLEAGDSFDFESQMRVKPDLLDEGGRGLWIIKELVDEMAYTPKNEEPKDFLEIGKTLERNSNGLNHWHLVKKVK